MNPVSERAEHVPDPESNRTSRYPTYVQRGCPRGCAPRRPAVRRLTYAIGRRIHIIARYAWALPATLAGLLLSLVAFAFGASGRVVEGAIEIAGGRFDRCISMLPRYCRFGAITFGHVIIGADHETLTHVRLHEHVHVRQYERWGVLFFPLYLASSLYQLVRGRHPYLNNCFEREALATSGDCNPTPDPAVNGDPNRRAFGRAGVIR